MLTFSPESINKQGHYFFIYSLKIVGLSAKKNPLIFLKLQIYPTFWNKYIADSMTRYLKCKHIKIEFKEAKRSKHLLSMSQKMQQNITVKTVIPKYKNQTKTCKSFVSSKQTEKKYFPRQSAYSRKSAVNSLINWEVLNLNTFDKFNYSILQSKKKKIVYSHLGHNSTRNTERQ